MKRFATVACVVLGLLAPVQGAWAEEGCPQIQAADPLDGVDNLCDSSGVDTAPTASASGGGTVAFAAGSGVTVSTEAEFAVGEHSGTHSSCVTVNNQLLEDAPPCPGDTPEEEPEPEPEPTDESTNPNPDEHANENAFEGGDNRYDGAENGAGAPQP